MGTNYYAHRILTQEEKKELHRAIDDDNLTVLKKYTENEEVHLCKMSYGWQVHFDHNWGKYYQPSRESLEEYLSRPDIGIMDEYGQTYTPKEFWEIVDTHNSDSHNHFTAKTYREWERINHPDWDQPNYWEEDIDHCRHLFHVEPEDTDFEVDGLRFSVYTQFC